MEAQASVILDNSISIKFDNGENDSYIALWIPRIY